LEHDAGISWRTDTEGKNRRRWIASADRATKQPTIHEFNYN
jgi:hypothetical protein